MESAGKQNLFWTRLAAVAAVGVLLVLLAISAFMWKLVASLETSMQEAGNIVSRLNETTKQLETVDWVELTENINMLAVSAQEGLDAAMEGLSSATRVMNDLDLVTLNKAIKDLADVVAPLASFFNRLR